MTDRPIIFSGPMVRALLAGRKTQTRRLASSPLSRAEPGDRLWARETYGLHFIWTGHQAARIPEPERCCIFYAADEAIRGGCSAAQRENRWRPAIHMPRWASRVTLSVKAVRTEPLQSISDHDAKAEGVEMESADPPFWWVPGLPTEHVHALPEKGETQRHCYLRLWDHLHGEGSSASNPDVLVLEFSIAADNIDRLAA